jgi:hypothetical protein
VAVDEEMINALNFDAVPQMCPASLELVGTVTLSTVRCGTIGWLSSEEAP